MDELDSFSQVVDRLLAKTRDPLSSRVSSATAAIVDIVEGNITPAKVYASVVTTLEGILHQDPAEVDSNTLLRSLDTEVALLKVLKEVVPHVAPSTLQATVALTSRVLRALFASTVSLLTDDNAERMLNTYDGLGVANNLLTMACIVSSEFLRHLPHQTEDAVIRRLLNETLLLLLQDSSRPKIQDAAKVALSELLLMKSPTCHPIVRNSATKYVNAIIDRYLKHPSHHSSRQNIIQLMGFLNPTLASMDFTSIGGRIMALLVDLLNQESATIGSHARHAVKSRATTLNIVTINSILAAILSLLESSDENEVDTAVEKKLDAFAARVLASLVQVKSTIVFREGGTEHDLMESGQLIYGQVMLSASQRLLRGEATAEVGAKLLPLVLQQVRGLSRPFAHGEKNVGESLYAEVSQLIRTNLQQLKENKTNLHERCSKECLQVLSSVIHNPFDPVLAPALQPLTILLQQMIPGDEMAKETLSTLVHIRSDPEINDNVRSFADGAFLSIVEGIGVESFWTAISLNELLCVPVNKISSLTKYAWVFDVIKRVVVGKIPSRLSFFQSDVLPLARYFDAMFANGGPSGEMCRSQVVNLWSLFPVFCRSPSDTEHAIPELAPILIKAMHDGRYPELIHIVCKGLDLLFDGANQRRDTFQELIEGEEATLARKEVQALSEVSVKLLPSLFKLVDTLHERKRQEEGEDAMETYNPEWNDDASKIIAVTECITWSARVAPKQQVGNLFLKLLQRILQTSQIQIDTSIQKMCSLLWLAQALVMSEALEESSIEFLYRSLKPLVRTDKTPPRVQKRAYKVLCEICKRYHSFIAEPDRLKELLDLLTNTSATSQIAARSMRLRCITTVVEGFACSGEGVNQVSQQLQRIPPSSLKNALISLEVCAFPGYHNLARWRDAAVSEGLQCKNARRGVFVVVCPV
jgi:hypothetical protein